MDACAQARLTDELMKNVFIPRAASAGAQVRSLINSKALTS